MSPLVAIGLVVLASCAKHREAPAAQESAAASSATGSAPASDRAAATEAARAQGVLGPSNQGSFDDKGEGGPDFQAKGGGSDDLQAKGGGGDGESRKATPTPSAGGGGVPLGTVALGEVELFGKGDATKVSAALTKQLDPLRRCYVVALRTKPGVNGHITLTFTLTPAGSFSEVVGSKSTLEDASLETCIVDSVKAAKLATPLGKAPLKGSIVIGFLP